MVLNKTTEIYKMKNFKQRFKKPFYSLLSLFLVLFFFRLYYGYKTPINDDFNEVHFFDNVIGNMRVNYASKEYKIKTSIVNTSPLKVDQKYEKIAEINTKSTKFEEHEKLLRKNILDSDALIQFEQKNGNKGARQLHLQIGVPPEKFDSLYNMLSKIGNVKSKQITKKDKTNEYKELNAKKTSLEKIRNSLIELKSKGGEIAEYIELENRILDIEQQLQGLGVNLGNFDDENEFCTVKFSIVEKKEVEISFIQRIKTSLEWTTKTYLKIIASLFFLTLFIYIVLSGIEKLKIIQKAD